MRTAILVLMQIMLGARRDPGVITVDVDLVNVLCSVREKNGGWARGLTKADFEIREDGKRQPITHFAAETDTPLTVALLLDVSGSVSTILDIEKAAARRFFDEVLRPTDQALLAGFSSIIPIWQDLTKSLPELRAALGRAGPELYPAGEGVRARGGTLLYDAVDLVADRKLKRITGRKTMILITDGQDNGSLVEIERAVRSAQEADAVVFAIHYAPESYGRGREGLRELERIAEPTGGRAFHVGEKLPLEKVFDEISDEMRHQYSIGFTPPVSVKDGRFHKLEVKVTKAGMKPQSRNGYYALPR